MQKLSFWKLFTERSFCEKKKKKKKKNEIKDF